MKKIKKIISTNKAPEAVGPYSQAVKYNNLLFISGQVSINPETGELEKESVAEETKRALLNIQQILIEAGSSLDKVLKCNVYLSDINSFNEMNNVYRSFFPNNPPARLCVSKVDIYQGLAVEIDAIAAV